MARAKRDLYSILGVGRDASSDDIRKAYRQLARESHPDLHPGDANAERRFKEIAGAYEILSDADKRKLYDEFGDDALRAGFDADKARTFRQWGGGGGGPGGGGFEVDIGDLLANLFGGRGGGGGGGPFAGGGGPFGGMGGRAPRGQDVLVRVDLDLRDAIRGTEIEVQVPDGGGGNGSRPSMLKVRVPPGSDEGTRLRVPSKGMPSPRGGQPGDLFIEVRLRSHPFFRREGLDLHVDLPITLSEAWDGANVDVPTPDGAVKIKVPARAKSGTKLRLRGKGVQRGADRGDIYVRLELQLPDGDDDELTEKLRATEALYTKPVRDGLEL